MSKILIVDDSPTQLHKLRQIVEQGGHQTVIAESGPLSIRSVGKALGDGKAGDTIRVKAEGSQRVVDGVVVSQGVIKVTL